MRTFTFADIAAYKAAKASGGSIYAALVGDATLKSGAVVSKITATGDVLIDALNPFVTPNLATNEDTLYYSSTEGYRSLRKGSTTWDANSLNQIYIDTSRLPSGFAVVEAYNDIFSFKSMQGETTGSGRSKMTSIRGNSVAWNQRIVDAMVVGAGENRWRAFDNSSTASVTDNVLTLTKSGGYGIVQYTLSPGVIVSGHKYYMSATIKTSAPARMVVVGAYAVDTVIDDSRRENVASSDWQKICSIRGCATASSQLFRVTNGETSDFHAVQIKNCEMFDLTLIFGAGNEPSTVAEFESMFPNAYYDYDKGRLISNAASAMEVTGFNQWDEEWEVGGINPYDGRDNDTNSAMRSKSYIPVLPGLSYNFTSPNGTWYHWYDANKNHISGTYNSATTFVVAAPSNAAYLRIQPLGAYGATYHNDICINLSDPAKNGTYEPYKKVIVPLDVTTIRVKSPNIWDEEWEVGAYYQSSGEKSDSASGNFRSKSKISCYGSTKYYAKIPSDGIKILFYSSSGAYLGVAKVVSLNQSGEFTTPASAAYFAFYCNFSGSYSNDICINKSDPGFNGKYYPHGSIVPYPEGMRRAGNAYDEIVDNKLIRRVGSVDLGTLTWSSDNNGKCFVSAQAVNGMADKSAPGMTCARFTPTDGGKAYNNTIDKSISNAYTLSSTHNRIVASDSAYNSGTAADFTTAMSGVMLNYEQANPEVFELDYPLTPIIYPAKGGTKRILPVNGSSPVTAPFSCMVQPI